MDPKRTIKISKFLSLVLRHEPQAIGITLDSAGWVDVRTLLDAMAFSEDGSRIRASQGHSVEVALGYAPAAPPELLYHGTVEKFLDSICQSGLTKGERHHVHLSPDRTTADKVGQRRGRPVILTIRSGQMHRDGMLFYLSANGVWLTDHVPAQYIEFPNETRP